jgi:hypothetical protein
VVQSAVDGRRRIASWPMYVRPMQVARVLARYKCGADFMKTEQYLLIVIYMLSVALFCALVAREVPILAAKYGWFGFTSR